MREPTLGTGADPPLMSARRSKRKSAVASYGDTPWARPGSTSALHALPSSAEALIPHAQLGR
eukprot:scaffold23378_cov103-Isochrysis_galbana.AAC.2